MTAIEYSAELAAEIAAEISTGTPLTAIAKVAGRPSLRTIHRWAAEREDFRDLLRQAREDAATSLFEQAREIADEAPLIIEHEGEKVTVRFDHAAVARNRERIRVRENAAAKLLPRLYSDRQTVAVGASPDLAPLSGGIEVVFAGMSPIEQAKKAVFVAAMLVDALPPEARVEYERMMSRTLVQEQPLRLLGPPTPLHNLPPEPLAASFYPPQICNAVPDMTPALVEEVEPSDVVDVGGGFLRIVDDQSNRSTVPEHLRRFEFPQVLRRRP